MDRPTLVYQEESAATLTADEDGDGTLAFEQTVIGGTAEWTQIRNKPFEAIGDNLDVTPDNYLYAIVPDMEKLTNSEIEEMLK